MKKNRGCFGCFLLLFMVMLIITIHALAIGLAIYAFRTGDMFWLLIDGLLIGHLIGVNRRTYLRFKQRRALLKLDLEHLKKQQEWDDTFG